jgi:hypothetical protein
MQPNQPQLPTPPENTLPVQSKTPKSIRLKVLLLLCIGVVIGCISIYLGLHKETKGSNETTAQITKPTETKQPTVTALDLTTLPLGDKKISTSPKKGYVFSCQTNFTGGGAFKQGPWINSATQIWNLTQKVTVDGDKAWNNANWGISNAGTGRQFTGNGLPKGHATGDFPILTSDDAYQYDRNPNSIKTQLLSLAFPANPTQLNTPECVGGEVGIMLSGVPLYNAFDAGGRDAVATEIQDKCDGHPQASGQYHYHGYSDCLQDSAAKTEHSALLGYAYDGFGIYGLRGENGQELSTNDLDECHGHNHTIMWDNKEVRMFHYHLTQDFPYSISCFRAMKTAPATPLPGGQANRADPPNRP